MGLSDFFIYDFLQYALIGTFFLAISSGLLSPIVVAKKHAFMGAALSHSTLFGVASALAVIEILPNISPIWDGLFIFILTFLITLIIVLILAKNTFQTQTPSDSLIGIFLALSMGLSVIIHQLFVTSGADLMSYLFGQIILLNFEDIAIVALATLLITLSILLKSKQWRAIIFDQDGAKLMGINVVRYHFSFYILLTIFVVAGVKISGTILVNSLLLAPGIFAFKYAHSLHSSFIIAIIFSLSTGISGLIIANAFNLPPGATMASIQCLALGLDKIFIHHKNF